MSWQSSMWVPSTTPDEADAREDKAMHITECYPSDECTGYLGPYETYVCICWCHRNPRERPTT